MIVKSALFVAATSVCQPASILADVTVLCQSGIPVTILVDAPSAGRVAISIREALALCQSQPANRT